MKFKENIFFEESYLLFEPRYKYFKVYESDKNYLSSRKSIGPSDQVTTSENDSYALKIYYYCEKIYLKFTSNDTLEEDKLTYTHGSIVNLYIVYFSPNITYSTKDDIVNDCLLGAVSLIKDGTIKTGKVKIQGDGVAFGS